MNISPADRYNMKDTCSNNGRGKKKPFVSSKGRHFLCVSSPWGLLTRLSWVSDELRLEINWKAARRPSASVHNGDLAIRRDRGDSRRGIWAKGIGWCRSQEVARHVIRFSWWTSMTSSNSQHVSRSGTIQDRAGDNLLEPRDNGLDIYIEGHNLMRLSVFLLMSSEDLSLWMCNISTYCNLCHREMTRLMWYTQNRSNLITVHCGLISVASWCGVASGIVAGSLW